MIQLRLFTTGDCLQQKKFALIVIIIKRKRKLGKNYFICLNSEKKCNFKFLGSLLIGQNDSLDVLLFSHYLPSEYILYICIYPLGSGSYFREGSSIGIRELLQGGIIHLDQGGIIHWDQSYFREGSSIGIRELLQGGIIHWDQRVTSGRDHPLGSESYSREGSSIGIRELLQGGTIH